MGTIFCVLIRLELSAPGSQFLAGDHHLYNVIIASHGTLIIYFTCIPIGLCLANYITPVTFPRLNNVSFWLLPPAIMLLLASIFVEIGMEQNCQSEWFSYSVLISLFLSGISYTLSVVNMLTTIWIYLNPAMPWQRQTSPNKVSQSIFAVVYIPAFICIFIVILKAFIFKTSLFDSVITSNLSAYEHISCLKIYLMISGIGIICLFFRKFMFEMSPITYAFVISIIFTCGTILYYIEAVQFIITIFFVITVAYNCYLLLFYCLL